MRFFSAITLAFFGIATFASAAPTSNDIPNSALPDGMPNPNKDELRGIELRAQGTLPNSPPQPTISKEGIISLQLIAFAELFEVAFFSELLNNITTNVPGFEIPNPDDRDFALRSLTAILAQEELHGLAANSALKEVKVRPIQPCQYSFPVSNYLEAISLASDFTELVLGTLQDAIERFAAGNDRVLARLIAAVVGQEGQQDGWYRAQQVKVPSQLPFLTTSDLNFAFTAVQGFTIPGSCPNIRDIPLTTFPPLFILTPPIAKTQNITVAWRPDPTIKGPEKLWLTYINQHNLPIVVPLQIVSISDAVIAEATFPYTENLMNGLTIAVVTTNSGPFPNADAVARATVLGPGLISIN